MCSTTGSGGADTGWAGPAPTHVPIPPRDGNSAPVAGSGTPGSDAGAISGRLVGTGMRMDSGGKGVTVLNGGSGPRGRPPG